MSKASAAIKRLFADETIQAVQSYRTPANDRTGAHRLHIGWRDSKNDYAGVIVIRDQIWAFEGLQASPESQRTQACDSDATYRDMLMSACSFGGFEGCERGWWDAPEDIRDEIFCIRGCAYFPAGPNAGEEPDEPESDATVSAAALVRVTRKTPFFAEGEIAQGEFVDGTDENIDRMLAQMERDD